MKIINLRHEKIKQRVTLLVIAFSYVPFLIFAEPPTFDSGSLIRWFAAQTGFLAALLFVWQFVLGTRSISAFVHWDQVWSTSVHRKLGTYGLVLVLLHPFLIAYSYVEGLDYIFGFDFSTEFQKHVSFGRAALVIFIVVWISSATLRANIGYRPWKFIHYLAYPMTVLALLHPPEIGTVLGSVNILSAYWTLLIIVFAIIVLLRISRVFSFGQSPYILSSKKQLGDGVVVYRLKPLSKQIKPHPGQYIYLRAGFFSEEHPFSVANYSSETGELLIAAKIFGRYTKRLSDVKTGTQLYLDGPYGVFTQEVFIEESTPVTFIAGGIGVTPFMQHITSSQGKNITLFNANRTKKSVVFGELLSSVLSERYIEVFSDPSYEGDGEKGYIDIALLKKYLGSTFEHQHFYICGPPGMMRAVRAALIEAGIAKSNISTEEFSF